MAGLSDGSIMIMKGTLQENSSPKEELTIPASVNENINTTPVKETEGSDSSSEEDTVVSPKLEKNQSSSHGQQLNDFM